MLSNNVLNAKINKNKCENTQPRELQPTSLVALEGEVGDVPSSLHVLPQSQPSRWADQSDIGAHPSPTHRGRCGENLLHSHLLLKLIQPGCLAVLTDRILQVVTEVVIYN